MNPANPEPCYYDSIAERVRISQSCQLFCVFKLYMVLLNVLIGIK